MEVGRDDAALYPLGHDDFLLLRQEAGHFKSKLMLSRIELHSLPVEMIDEQRAVEKHAGGRRLLAIDLRIHDDGGKYLRKVTEPIDAVGSDETGALLARARSKLGASLAKVARDPCSLRLFVCAQALRFLLGLFGLVGGRRLLGLRTARAHDDENRRPEHKRRESASPRPAAGTRVAKGLRCTRA